MANWNEICEKIGVVAEKAVKKTGELADGASKFVKLKAYDSKLSSRYEELGRLTYKQLKTETSYAQRISKVIEEIDTLREERNALQAEIDEEKRRKAERKADNEEDLGEAKEKEDCE